MRGEKHLPEDYEAWRAPEDYDNPPTPKKKNYKEMPTIEVQQEVYNDLHDLTKKIREFYPDVPQKDKILALLNAATQHAEIPPPQYEDLHPAWAMEIPDNIEKAKKEIESRKDWALYGVADDKQVAREKVWRIQNAYPELRPAGWPEILFEEDREKKQ